MEQKKRLNSIIMKKILLLLLVLYTTLGFINAQTTKTVGGVGANYATLKAAFDAINAGSINGVIVLQITGSTTETASAVLNKSGIGGANYSSIKIYPTGSGYSILGNLNADLINLNGVNNLIIDGRVNQSGVANLTFQNSSIFSSATTIKYSRSASNNIIKYSYIKGSCPNSTGGIIVFGNSTSGVGNDANIIDNNYISSSSSGRPYNVIYSSGTNGRENSENIISNNNIFDFLNSTSSVRAINIGSNSSNWSVLRNSFYETTTIIPNSTHTYFMIYTNTSTNHLISGNYIGGSEPYCGGNALTINSSFGHYFYCMYINGGISTPVTVENNTIQNINYTSTNSNPWDGIYLASGKIDVIGNTIGGRTGTDSIVINTPNASASATISGGVVTALNIVGGGSGFTTAPLISFSTAGSSSPAVATAIISGGAVTGYTLSNGGVGYTSAPLVYFNSSYYSTSHGIRHLSTGTVNITNNNIGAITAVGSDTYSHCFEAIVISGNATSVVINNNIIGSLTTPNSIQTPSTAISSLTKQDLRGIFVNSSIPTATINGNTIANLTSSYLGSPVSKVDGICISGGSNTIQNNTIRDISAATNSIIVKGVQQLVSTSGTAQVLTGNIIYNLSNTHPTAMVNVYGIHFSSATNGTNSVSGNFIHSLTASSTNINSEIDGIYLGNGVLTCANNIINLGTTVTTGCKIYGIYENSSASSANINNVYFNSIYIGGSIASGVTSPTSALRNMNNTTTRNYRNNIFFNERSGGTTGKHYAVFIAGTLNLTIDYNDYFVNGTGGVIGSLGGDRTTLTTFKTATGQDVNSLNLNPLFTSNGGLSSVHYYTAENLPGISIATITSDFNAVTRGSTPKMGALEANNYVWQGATSTDFATASNWSGNVVPASGANITFASNPDRHCILDVDRVLGNITNAQNADQLILNGNQVTILGNLNFSNGAQIDATSSGSVVIFEGTSAQNIPTGAFVSNTIDGLSINNVNGLTLNGDLTVEQSLSLSNGTFTLGANTLTLNGAINSTTGTLIGGVSTNIVFGGTSATTILPSIILNNLTLNRANGISLGGDVSVGGTLTLTSGSLTIGANVLTISGNSPSRTSGNIIASNANATLVFDNSSAILLPSNLFSGNINNLTITGVGGVTAGDDLTVDGILNLAAENPSATKGLLEMTIDHTNYPGTLITHYLNSHLLNMGADATTIGIGDVTGTVKRSTIVENTPYTFGNQFTTISLTPGTMPSALAVSITIGNSPVNPRTPADIIRDAVKRTYEIVPTGGSDCYVTANFHYLDSELTSNATSYLNSEMTLTTMDFDIDINNHGFPSSDEHGRANYDYTNNYIGLSGVPISYFIQIPTTHEWRTIFALRDYSLNYITWDGSTSSDWNTPSNWTILHGGDGVPTELSHVTIPDAATTPNDPILNTGTTLINTLSIENGGVLTMGSNTLIIQNSFSGGWEDQNPLGNDPGTSTVVFTRPNTSISGNARFYNVEIAAIDAATDTIADITNQTGSKMKIENSITRTGLGTGKWFADAFDNTVEYSKLGDQTILTPDGSTHYHHLLLSGSGVKSIPSMITTGNITCSGAVTASATGAHTIGGNLIIENGTIYNTGSYNHSIAGDFDNNGTFNASSGYSITMNGSVSQSILGADVISFDKLEINNAAGVANNTFANVENELILTSGSLSINGTTFGLNGTISKSAGFLEVSTLSSLNFGGTTALTLNNDLFLNTPSIDSLIVDRSGGITLGNQNLTVNGLLKLTSGTLSLGPNTLTIAGESPVRSSGNINASNSLSTLEFANSTAITLPTSFINGNLNNLTLNGIGGLTLTEDITINNNLQFDAGLIHTGSNNLIMNSASNSVIGAGLDKFIDGNCRKIGNTAFLFPVGSNGLYAPIGISAANGVGVVTDYFTANYVNVMPNTDGLDSTKHDASIVRISKQEYWNLSRSGTNEVAVTLTWDARSGGVSNLSELTVAHWDSGTPNWEDKGNAATTGDTSSGTITSGWINSFSPFTLASKKASENTLPVSYLFFENQCENNHSLLSWATISELNCDYFEIQKSADGVYWTFDAKIKGAGNSNQLVNYKYVPNFSSVYYRLKQVDFDGKFNFSEIVTSQNCNETSTQLKLFPNPTTGKINIQFNGEFNDIQIVEVYNNVGGLVYSSNNSKTTIDLSEKPNGIYYVRIVLQSKIIIEKVVVDK